MSHHISTKREIAQQKTRFRVFAGMYDFLSTLGGILVLVIALIVLISLISWIRSSGIEYFSRLFGMLDKALIQ